MLDLFDPGRPLSASVMKQVTTVYAIALLIFGIFAMFNAIGTLFAGHVLIAFAQMAGIIGVIGFMYLSVRFLLELLLAVHRLNDRLTIMDNRDQ